jgi:hypothetical protein
MHIRCTIHNLEFAFDEGRVKALGVQPALLQCPVCAFDKVNTMHRELEGLREHRDILLRAFDLKRVLEVVSPPPATPGDSHAT